MKLKETDICQGCAQNGDKRDIIGWIETIFESQQERYAFEKVLALHLDILPHFLTRWNDLASPSEVAKTFNKVYKEFKRDKTV